MPDSRKILIISRETTVRDETKYVLQKTGFSGFEIIFESEIETGFAAIQKDKSILAVVTVWHNPNAYPVKPIYPAFNGRLLLESLRGHAEERLRNIPVVVFSFDGYCRDEARSFPRTQFVWMCTIYSASFIPAALEGLLGEQA